MPTQYKKNVFFPFLSSCLQQDPRFLKHQADESSATITLNNKNNLVVIKFLDSAQEVFGFQVLETHLSIFKKSSDFYHYTAKLKNSDGELISLRFYFDTDLMLPSRTECSFDEGGSFPLERLGDALSSFRCDALKRVKYWTPIIKEYRERTLSSMLETHRQLSEQLNQVLFEEESVSVTLEEKLALLSNMEQLCVNIQLMFPQLASSRANECAFKDSHYRKISEILLAISPHVSQQSSPEKECSAKNLEELKPDTETSVEQKGALVFRRPKKSPYSSHLYQEASNILEEIATAERNLQCLESEYKLLDREQLISLIEREHAKAREAMLSISGTKIDEMHPKNHEEKLIHVKFLLRSQLYLQHYNDLSFRLTERLFELCLNQEHDVSERLLLGTLSEDLEQVTSKFTKEIRTLAQNHDVSPDQCNFLKNIAGFEVRKIIAKRNKETTPTTPIDMMMAEFALKAVPPLLQKVALSESESSDKKGPPEQNDLNTKICAIIATAFQWQALNTDFWNISFTCNIGGESHELSLKEFIVKDWQEHTQNSCLLRAVLNTGKFDLFQNIWSDKYQAKIPLGLELISRYKVSEKEMNSLQLGYGQNPTLIVGLKDALQRNLRANDGTALISEEIIQKLESDFYAFDKSFNDKYDLNTLCSLAESYFSGKFDTPLPPPSEGTIVDMFKHMRESATHSISEQSQIKTDFHGFSQANTELKSQYPDVVAYSFFLLHVALSCLINDEQEKCRLETTLKESILPNPHRIDDEKYATFSQHSLRRAIQWHERINEIIIGSQNPQYCFILQKYYKKMAILHKKTRASASYFSRANARIFDYQWKLFEHLQSTSKKMIHQHVDLFSLEQNPEGRVYWELVKKLKENNSERSNTDFALIALEKLQCVFWKHDIKEKCVAIKEMPVFLKEMGARLTKSKPSQQKKNRKKR